MSKQIKLRNATPSSIDEKNHTVRVRFTDESVDTYGTSLKYDGWDFSRFNDNPIVQLEHWADASANIGRVLEIIPVPEERAYDAIIQFDVEDTTEYGGLWAWGKVSRGFLRTWSVGFENLVADGMDYLQNMLYEISLVGVPSNTGATTRALKDGSITEAEADRLLKRYAGEAKRLQEYLKRDNNNSKSEEATMNKDEVTALLDEKLAPITKALEGVAKLDESIKAAVEEATKPITDTVKQLTDKVEAAKAATTEDDKDKGGEGAEAKDAKKGAGKSDTNPNDKGGGHEDEDDEEISDEEAEQILKEYEADLDKEFEQSNNNEEIDDEKE